MNKKLQLLGRQTAIGNRFKAQVIERRPGHADEGKVVFETPFAPNLILENGMNRLAVDSICNLFVYCAIGTDATPTQDSSGSITATASGTTVTSSGAFFGVGDVGKLLRFNTGQKAVITGFTDNQHVTVATSLTVGSATLFTMYRIAQTGLFAEVHRTNNYLTGSGNCGTTAVSGVYTHTRTYDFPIEGSTQVYNEVGFSNSATIAANLNMRGIFAGAPITVLSGQQLRVIYDVIVTTSPVSPRSKNVAISGWPSLQHPVAADPSTDLITLVAHGFILNTQVQFIGTTPPSPLAFGTVYYVVPNNADTFKLSATPSGGAIDITTTGSGVILLTNTNGQEQLTTDAVSQVNTSGATVPGTHGNINEPFYSSKVMNAVSDATAIPAFPSGSPPTLSGASNSVKTLSQDSYTTGSYLSTWRGTYATTENNQSNIRKLYLGDSPGGGNSLAQTGICFLFDQAQEKTNLFTLTVVWAFSWDRDFI